MIFYQILLPLLLARRITNSFAFVLGSVIAAKFTIKYTHKSYREMSKTTNTHSTSRTGVYADSFASFPRVKQWVQPPKIPTDMQADSITSLNHHYTGPSLMYSPSSSSRSTDTTQQRPSDTLAHHKLESFTKVHIKTTGPLKKRARHVAPMTPQVAVTPVKIENDDSRTKALRMVEWGLRFNAVLKITLSH
jgi:hypothetical protein